MGERRENKDRSFTGNTNGSVTCEGAVLLAGEEGPGPECQVVSRPLGGPGAEVPCPLPAWDLGGPSQAESLARDPQLARVGP